MNGRILAGGLVLFAAIFGAALWYFQLYAYYEDVTGLETVEVQGRAVPVSDYRGVDADTSPNKLRGCFTVDPDAFEGVPLAENPEPLIAPPGWTVSMRNRSPATLRPGGRSRIWRATKRRKRPWTTRLSA